MAQDSYCLPDSEIAKQLNTLFAGVFTQESFPLPGLDVNPSISEMSPITIAVEGTGLIIDGLPVGSSLGQDSINFEILKMTKSISSLYLCKNV